MSRKTILLTVIVLAAMTGGFFICKQFNRRNPDLSNLKPAYVVQANELIKEFSNNDSSANLKYLGKIVSVEGRIKKIDQDQDGYYTVVLGDSTELSSVRCALDSTHMKDAAKLQPISSVRVKGYFTGFEKDETGLVGSDLKLNRCVIEKQNK